MARDFYPERTDPRGLQKNQRALERLLDQLFDVVDGDALVVLLAGKSGGQTILQGLTLEGGVVVNDLGADADTRVEGDTEPNLVFVDASTDRVGIGTATPANRLHVRESSAGETVSGQFENAGGGGVQFRLAISTRVWALRASAAGFEVRDVTGAGAIFSVAQGAPAGSLAVGSTGRLTLGPGSPRFIGRTSTAADPTTTELPADKDFGLHKNTASGAVFLAYNDGGAIKKVALA